MEKFTGKFVDTKTSDGVELLGLLAEREESNTIVIHFHGMQGNFFQNNFVQEMLAEYPEKGFSFLTVEQRGAEAVRMFPKNDHYLKAGNAFETFEECIYDIQAWIEFAKKQDYENIYLQGHSLGCSKIAYYLSESKTDIEGVIFISPADMHGIFGEYVSKGSELLEEAKEMREKGRGDEIIVEQHDGWKYLSADTLVNLYDKDSNAAIFNFWRPEIGFETFQDIGSSVLAFIGTEDDGIATDPYKSMEMLREKAGKNFEVRTKVLKGAEHDFRGFEKEIIEEVQKQIL